jgi:hypothetical protein
MRNNKKLAAKTGLLPSMRIYKFFQTIYGYHKGKRYQTSKKTLRPKHYSYIFINDDYGYIKQVEKDFGNYFVEDLKLEKNIQETSNERNETEFIWQTKKNWQLVDILKMCLHFANHNSIKKNRY